MITAAAPFGRATEQACTHDTCHEFFTDSRCRPPSCTGEERSVCRPERMSFPQRYKLKLWASATIQSPTKKFVVTNIPPARSAALSMYLKNVSDLGITTLCNLLQNQICTEILDLYTIHFSQKNQYFGANQVLGWEKKKKRVPQKSRKKNGIFLTKAQNPARRIISPTLHTREQTGRSHSRDSSGQTG